MTCIAFFLLIYSSLVDFTQKEGATLALVLNTAADPGKPYFRDGYECMQKRNYAAPSGLASFPAIMILPAPIETDLNEHWPNIVSLIDGVDKKPGIKFYDGKVGTWYGIHAVSRNLFLVCIITGCSVKQDVGGFDGIVRHVGIVYGLATVSECFK
jgi:hypothetical protein